MPYTFISNLPVNEFNEFLKRSSFAPVFQTEAWAKLKTGWKHDFIGIRTEDQSLVGVAMILIRHVVPGFSFGYCPRGPVFDLSNHELLRFFTQEIKKYGKKRGLCYIKIDPLIPVTVTLPDLKMDLFFNPYENMEDVFRKEFEQLSTIGWKHKGFGKVLSDYIQPRYNTLVPLKDRKNERLTPDALKKNFRPSIRKYVGSFSDNRGIFSEMPEITDDVIKEFTRLIHSTEERQGIYLRGEEYFRQLCSVFGENVKILLAKCRVPIYRKYLEDRLKNEPENESKIRELIVEAETVIKEKGEIITLAGMLLVFPSNHDGVRVAEYLYTGADLSVFSSFHITLSCLYDAMLYCIGRDIDMLDLGGVEGTLDDGLYEFKSKFCPILCEYYGEFDLILSGIRYSILEKYLPSAVHFYKKMTRAFKKETKRGRKDQNTV